MVSKCVKDDLSLHTFYLLMIVFCFSGQLKKKKTL